MHLARKKLATLSLIYLLLILPTILASGSLPHVLHLKCDQDGVLYKSSGSYELPPNEKCWGWYHGHLYSIAYAINSSKPILGHSITVTEICAKVTGGISELNRLVKGFKIDVLPAKVVHTGNEIPPQFLSIPTEDIWKTLVTFSAPCSAGPAQLVHWQGPPLEIGAIRVVAPGGHYVDHSTLWIEYR